MCWHLTNDNSLLVVIHQTKLIPLGPIMAGHHEGKGAKIAQFWSQNVNQKFTFLPIKGGADFSAQNKEETQLNSAKISAPKTVPKPLKTEPKSHQKPSKNCVKTKFFSNRVCVSSKGWFCKIFLSISAKICGLLGVWNQEKKFGF